MYIKHKFAKIDWQMKLTPGITLTTERQSLFNCGNEILDERQGTS